MKRNFGVLAVATLLACMTVTSALAAGRGGSGIGAVGAAGSGAGAFRSGAPFIGSVPSTPPVFNPSTPYTVPQAPEQSVSPASPGSIFGNG
jgi:hypothetical protein